MPLSTRRFQGGTLAGVHSEAPKLETAHLTPTHALSMIWQLWITVNWIAGAGVNRLNSKRHTYVEEEE